MTRSSTIRPITICIILTLWGLFGGSVSWAARFYLPPSPTPRYLFLHAPIDPTSPEACEALQEEFTEIQQELDAQHGQCLRDAPDEEHGDDHGTCSKASCQRLHTARDEAGQMGRQEVRLCRQRLQNYLTEKRREDEQDRMDHKQRNQDRDRWNTDRKERDRHTAQEQADRARRDAEDRAEREQQEERDRQARVEQQRRQAEALRQAHIRAVRKTADQLKDTWQDRIRNTLPETASDLSSFMQVVHGMAKGDGSYKLADLVAAADTLAERAETASKWITSPLQSFSDQVTAEAINLVRADRGYQRDDPRMHTIFRGIQKINELAHDTNPFSKAISSAAFDQIEHQFKTIMGELKHLEADIGSFNYANRKHADQPIANPFKGTPPKQTASTVEVENPFRSSSTGRPQEPPSSSHAIPSPNADSTNPFRTGGSGPDILFTPPKPTPSQTAKQPLATRPTDATVRYRDPATEQLSTKRRMTLPASTVGDDPDGTRCSADGMGIVTEQCEQQRRAQSSKATGSTR